MKLHREAAFHSAVLLWGTDLSQNITRHMQNIL